MPLLHPRAFPLSLVSLTFAHAGLAEGADTDTTTPPRIDLLEPSQTFSSTPSQFTSADLDGDGDQDIVHLPEGGTGDQRDPHAYWFENLGARQFGPLRLIHLAPTAAGQTLTGAKVWDLTGDAKPEIFVNRNSTHLSDVYYPFALTPGLDENATAPIEPTALNSSAVGIPWALVDLDGTGEPYLLKISSNNLPGETTISLYRRNDTGSGAPFMPAFQTTSSYYSPFVQDSEGLDVDGDGDGDLCVASSFTMRIYERKDVWPSAAEPRTLTLPVAYRKWLDLNGDGRKDILLADGSWMRNDGNWNFTPRPQSPASFLLDGAAFSKVVPRDGQSALVHAIVLTENQNGYERIVIPFDSATPLVREGAPGSPGDNMAFLLDVDLDGDGHLDLVYSYSAGGGQASGSPIMEILWGSPSGHIAPQYLWTGPALDHQVFAADLNADLLPDLVSGPDARGRYRIRFNAGVTGKPVGDGILIEGLDIPGTEVRILGAARIDKDKYPDLVCSYTKIPVAEAGPQHALVVVRGRKDGSFIAPAIPDSGLVFGPRPKLLDGGGMASRNFVDWDRDGDLDFITAGLWYENVKGSFPGTPRVLLGIGTMPDFLGNPASIGGTITGDIDGDRAPDIISLVHGTGTLIQPPGKMLVGFNDGRGGIEETLELPFQLAAYDFLGNPILPGGAVLADLNGDKRLDLWVRVVAGTDGFGNPRTAEMWLRNPGRRNPRGMNGWVFAPLLTDDVNVPPGVAFGDFDGDRKPWVLAKSSGEWLSPWGYVQSTKRGPQVSTPYDFTNHHIDLTKVGFAGGVDIDGDRDTDFILGGGKFPLVLLYNPNAEGGKRRPMKAKEVEWLGSLPVVR